MKRAETQTRGPPRAESGFGPGFYGKVPVRGDFVRHDLTSPFVEAWDAFLGQVMTGSRARLGAMWERMFAAGPVWRFALAADLCGPAAVTGVMLASADRVGRPFPFVVAAALPEKTDLGTVPFALALWLRRAEEIGREAVAGAADFERLPASLDRLGPPSLGFGAANPRHRARLEAMVGTLPPRPSVWWTRGGHWVMPSLAVCQGLPSGERFAAFLDNGWERWGWQDGDGDDERDDDP